MANELTRGGALPSRHTGADRYVQALLSAGEAAGRINSAQAQQVHLELERMLTRLAVTYTFGASGSMPAETAKHLLPSAAYAIGVALKMAPSPDAALDKLLSVPPDELRREGIAAEGAMQLEATIADLSDQMLAAAGELKFELAARLRDEVQDLKKELRAMERAGHA